MPRRRAGQAGSTNSCCSVSSRAGPACSARWMLLLLGWLLVALFIWFAENIGTFARAWAYPAQKNGWAIVSPAKLGAWYLLMYVSFVLVASLHRTDAAARSRRRGDQAV